MNIVRNDQTTHRRFDELKTGDVFIETYDGNEYIQMKIPDANYGCEDVNAVSLTSGELYYIEPCVRVRVVNADLVVK